MRMMSKMKKTQARFLLKHQKFCYTNKIVLLVSTKHFVLSKYVIVLTENGDEIGS